MCYPLSPSRSDLDFHLVLVKGKWSQNIREITKSDSYLSGSFGENRVVFLIGETPEKKGESLRFLGLF